MEIVIIFIIDILGETLDIIIQYVVCAGACVCGSIFIPCIQETRCKAEGQQHNSTTAQQHTEELQRNIRTRRSAGLGRGAVSLKTSRTGSQLRGGAGRGAEEGSGGGGVTEEEEEETLPGLSCQLNTAPYLRMFLYV